MPTATSPKPKTITEEQRAKRAEYDRKRRTTPEGRAEHNRQGRQYCQDHKEKHIAAVRQWHRAHPEIGAEQSRRYRAQHPEKILQYSIVYRLNNPDKIEARRLAQRIPLGDKCEECGATINLERHHEDYSRPLEVHTLCRSCNMIEA